MPRQAVEKLPAEPWLATRKERWGYEDHDECQLYILLTPSEGEQLAAGQVPDDVREQVTEMLRYARGEKSDA